MIVWILFAKTLLDLAAGITLGVSGKAPQACMFMTFVMVDLSTLWVSL